MLTRKELLVSSIIIALALLHSCRSTKKAITTVKTEETKATRTVLTNELKEVDMSTLMTDESVLEITVDAFSGETEASITTENGKTVIKGGKITFTKTKTTEAKSDKISREGSHRSEANIEEATKTDQKSKEIKRFGISLLWILPALLAAAAAGIYFLKKNGLINLNLWKSKDNN